MRRRKDALSSQVEAIDERLTSIRREIRSLERFIANPPTLRRRDEVTKARLLGSTIMPESKKRFVSYLSTGSFQTIGLRKHEQKAAKVKAILLLCAALFAFAAIVYTFILPFLR